MFGQNLNLMTLRTADIFSCAYEAAALRNQGCRFFAIPRNDDLALTNTAAHGGSRRDTKASS